MKLSSYFTTAAFKILRRVDLPHLGSNQHEINGNTALRDFFQTSEKIYGKIHWFYFADNREPVSTVDNFTFYDSRAAHPSRTEWRLYYHNGDFFHQASPRDVLVLTREPSGKLFGLVFQQDSVWLQTARVLFDFDNPIEQFQLIPHETLDNQRIEFARQQIIEALELSQKLKVPSLKLKVVERCMIVMHGKKL